MENDYFLSRLCGKCEGFGNVVLIKDVFMQCKVFRVKVVYEHVVVLVALFVFPFRSPLVEGESC